MTHFSVLMGKTLVAIKGLEVDSERVVFCCSDGSEYLMYHDQDCCESVYVAEIHGDPSDLVSQVIGHAEESSGEIPDADESGTWTFYQLATVKGWVNIRWIGESNGYYSESVDFVMTKKPENDVSP